jgi:ATP-dependent RNA helicase RhlE
MPREIRVLADGLLREPHVVELNHSRPVSTIEHALYPVDSDKKLDLLRHVMGEDGFASAIVFTRTKHRARRVARQLETSGHRAVALQGNMSQGQRDRAMQGFRDRRYQILVATDIAARGIDVEKVSHVINFDMPGTVDAYTHRIGRTGRSEREGKGYTFVTTDDEALVRAVERTIGARIPRRTVDGFADIRPAERRTATTRAPRTTDRRRIAENERQQSQSRRRRYRRAS